MTESGRSQYEVVTSGEVHSHRKGSVVGILSLVFLILILLLVLYLIGTRTSFFNMASSVTTTTTVTPATPTTSVAIENSYMFASPLKAASGGQEKIRITVFVLDGKGAGVSGKSVSLGNIQGLSVFPVQPLTDTLGRAIFDVSSLNPGNFEVSALVGSLVLPQKVTITFGG